MVEAALFSFYTCTQVLERLHGTVKTLDGLGMSWILNLVLRCLSLVVDAGVLSTQEAGRQAHESYIVRSYHKRPGLF